MLGLDEINWFKLHKNIYVKSKYKQLGIKYNYKKEIL